MPFIVPDSTPAPFHILSVSGRPKVGKTHLASSGPGVVAIQSLDFGTDGVVQKVMKETQQQILVAEYSVEVDLTADDLMKNDQKDESYAASGRQAAKVTKELWIPFVKDYKEQIAEPGSRTIVWDRADEVNEMLRLANFGRLERNPQLGYVPVNAEYKQLVRMASQAKKNLVLIHGMDKEYKDMTDPNNPNRTKSVETGNYKRLGNSKADFLVHSFIELDYQEPVRGKDGAIVKPARRTTKIIRARLNPEVDGMVIDTPNWGDLMMFLAPDVPREAWGV